MRIAEEEIECPPPLLMFDGNKQISRRPPRIDVGCRCFSVLRLSRFRFFCWFYTFFRSVLFVWSVIFRLLCLRSLFFCKKKEKKRREKTINNNKSNNETKLLLLLMLLLRMRIKNATLLFVIIFSHFCCLKMRIDSIRKYYVYFSTIRSPPFFFLLHQVLCFMGSV